jgi:hypothetical protein
MASRRFTRLSNGFSKKLDNHYAAVALYVGHYNLCRYRETIRSTPAVWGTGPETRENQVTRRYP